MRNVSYTLRKNHNRISTRRNMETEEERESRLQQNRDKESLSRATETIQKLTQTLDAKRNRMAQSKRIDLKLAAFNYNKDDDYRSHKDVVIGAMNKVCSHYGALNFAKESPGMCCSNGKVVVSPLMKPPEPLLSYISKRTPTSKLFFQNIRKYNSCFQMTSIGSTNIVNVLCLPPYDSTKRNSSFVKCRELLH